MSASLRRVLVPDSMADLVFTMAAGLVSTTVLGPVSTMVLALVSIIMDPAA